MGSWHYNLGPRVSLNPMEEGGGCAPHGERSRVVVYLSGASFLLPLFLSSRAQATVLPHSGQTLTLINTLKPPSQMELEFCLCNLQGASQCSGVRTKVNPHTVINMWLTLGSVAEQTAVYITMKVINLSPAFIQISFRN